MALLFAVPAADTVAVTIAVAAIVAVWPFEVRSERWIADAMADHLQFAFFVASGSGILFSVLW